jgi:N-acetylglutamate synthase
MGIFKKTKTQVVSIRAMKAGDHAQALDLWKRSRGVGLRGDDTRANLTRYLKRNPGLSLVAVSHGKIVGTVLGGHDGRRGTLFHLAVDQAFRGMGLGRRLVSLCLRKLEKAGIPRTHVMVIGTNRTGLRFWKQIGWLERTDLVLFSSHFQKGE